MAAPIHLHPTADLAPRVLLPGDPGRALLLAQTLLDTPLMFNHHRGLWGYTGTAADGEPLVAIDKANPQKLADATAANFETIFRAVSLSRLASASDYRSDQVTVAFNIRHEGSDKEVPLDASTVPTVSPLRPSTVLMPSSEMRPIWSA